MVNNYHYLLMPAFVVQSRVRSKIFGYFIDWEAEETKREKTKYTTMVDIIKKIDETAEKQVKHLGGGEALRGRSPARSGATRMSLSFLALRTL